MTISSVGESGLNQYPVNFQLMRQLLLAAKERAPFYAGTTPGTLSKNAGTSSVRWERIENLTRVTTPLSELTGVLTLPTRAGVVPAITQLDATMVKYGNTIYITEELDLMSVNARASKFMDTLGENLGASLNGIMEAVFSGSTVTRFGNGVASAILTITAIAANDIRFSHNAINRLGGKKFKADAFGSVNVGSSPVRSSYLGICHVDVEEDVRQISGFLSVEQYGGYTDTFPFEFGTVGGVRWISTELDTLITENAGTTSASNFRGDSDTENDVYDSYVFGMDAIGSVGLGDQHTKEIYMTGDRMPAVEVHTVARTATIADPQAEIAAISWKSWLVGRILQNDWLVKVRTLASD